MVGFALFSRTEEMLHLAPADITFNGTTAIIFVQGCQGSERTFCHWSAWNWMSLLQSRRSSNFCNYIKGQKQNVFGVSPGDPFRKPGATLLPICSSPMVFTNHIHYIEGEPPAPTKTACRCTLLSPKADGSICTQPGFTWTLVFRR